MKAKVKVQAEKDSGPDSTLTSTSASVRSAGSMSNILAAIGRGQLLVLPQRIAARRRNYEFFQDALGGLPGIEFMPEAKFGRSTRWLTCLTIEPAKFGATREDVRLALERENIESRLVPKPMHPQPVFEAYRVRGGGVSERLFEKGRRLPSGSALTEQDLERICTVGKSVRRKTAFHCVPPAARRVATRTSRAEVSS